MKTRIFLRISLKIMKIICGLIPKNKNQVLFYSKPDFADNGRALYEKYMELGLNLQYRTIWIVNGNISFYKKKYPETEFYLRNSIKGFLMFCRSKLVFRSHGLYGNIRSHKQKIVLIWHGMGIKGPMDHNYEPNVADYVTVTSDLYRYRISSRFRMPPSHCIITGLPRNDYMFAGKEKICLNALEKVASHPDCKTILWVPTFHKDEKTGDKDGKFYELGVPVLTWSDLEPFNEFLEEKNIVLIIKLHPHMTGEGTIHQAHCSNIQILEDWMLPDDCTVYHLLGGVDAMLTDYSSMFTDFMLLDRPIGFIYDDFEEYSKHPGFAFEKVKLFMPGVHIGSMSELYQFIEDFSNGIDKEADTRHNLNQFINYYQDGLSSVRVLQALGLCSKGNRGYESCK